MGATDYNFKPGQLFSSTDGRCFQFLVYGENHSLICLDISGIGSLRLYKVPLNCVKDDQPESYPVQPAITELALHILENPGHIEPLYTNIQANKKKPHNVHVEGLQLPLYGFEYMLLERVQIK